MGIGTPTPDTRLHMKTTGTGFWSPLTIEAETDANENGANAVEFRKSRGSNVSAENDDDLGNIFFSYLDAQAPSQRQWKEAASIDSRVRVVATTPSPEPGQETTGDGELTINIVERGVKKERFRIHANGHVNLGTGGETKRANLLVRGLGEHCFIDAVAAQGMSAQFRLWEALGSNEADDRQRWAMHIQPNDTTLYWWQGPEAPVGGNKMKLDAAGNLYIKGSYQQFSPAPPKAVITPDDFLDLALEDAMKPAYPGDRLPEDPAEIERYRKDISKIAIGTARYAEHVREQISMLEARLARLEGR